MNTELKKELERYIGRQCYIGFRKGQTEPEDLGLETFMGKIDKVTNELVYGIYMAGSEDDKIPQEIIIPISRITYLAQATVQEEFERRKIQQEDLVQLITDWFNNVYYEYLLDEPFDTKEYDGLAQQIINKIYITKKGEHNG